MSIVSFNGFNISELQLCYDLVKTQTDAPWGCDSMFIHALEDLRVKLMRILQNREQTRK